ncbi:MAG: DUF362 domain-containing protein [Candidatus Heimdallarchaeota archaeon]
MKEMGSNSSTRLAKRTKKATQECNILEHVNLETVHDELKKWLERHSFDNIIVKPNWVTANPLTRTELDLFTATVRTCLEIIESVTVADCPIDKTNFNDVKSFYKNALKGDKIKVRNLWRDRTIIVDVHDDSLFMPLIEADKTKYRMGPQRRTPQEHHFDDTHEYGVSKHIYEAEGIIHLPRLKTHRLAGITGCAKSFIGVVVKKYWLPHYTQDYDQPSLPTSVERRIRIARMKERYRIPSKLVPLAIRKYILKLAGAKDKVDEYLFGGAWEGNDTIWRTIWDLLQIFKHIPQFYILDGRIAGQGHGPMKPDPLPLHKIWTGEDALAVDSCGSMALETAKAKMPEGWISPYRHENIRIFDFMATGDSSPRMIDLEALKQMV